MDYYRDALAVKGVFPEYSLEEIIPILEEIGNKEDRIRIAVMKLLRRSDNLSLKRAFDDDAGEDCNKKRKISESTSTVGKANSTIVRPTFPEEDEPPRFLTPPWEQPQFLKVPLNVTSKIQFFPFPIPENVVRNVQENKNTAPEATHSAAPTNNCVNDTYMLNNILSDDVMKVAVDSEKEEIRPEATAKGAKPVNTVEADNNNLIYPLLEIFPEACPEFIRWICRGKTNAPGVIDDLISEILQSNYPKRNKVTIPVQTMVANAQLEMLKQILPDAYSEEEEILLKATEKGAGPVNPVEAENDNLFYTLLEIFPEASPQYIRRICRGKTNAPGVIDDLISEILESDYQERNKTTRPVQTMDLEAQLEMLKQILPDADPSYLEIHCYRLMNQPNDMKTFIANAIENPSYPKLKDYLRKQQISAQQKQYTTEFTVENFLEVIPDPPTYFEDPKRKQTGYRDYESQHYAICFLQNQFRRIPLSRIRGSFKSQNQNLLQTFKLLEKFDRRRMITTRAEVRMPELIQNIPLLQEISYIQHRNEIQEYIRLQKVREEEERAAAAAAGLTLSCSCCFDNEVLPKHIYECENGCTFCRECVQRGAEVSFGEGKLDFACLNNCSSHFSLQTLQAVLKPKLFSKIAIKKQMEEVKAAGIEDLEMCPFCDFATIPAKEDRIFRCLNPECMKESCRLCKEPSHVPLRCEEVEKDDDVKKRTYIENKMTEALLRTCYKCNKKFVKAEGCNKMTCSCGALMCYVCGKPVKDYTHFNAAGGKRFHLCPLFSNTKKMHQENVLKGAEQAKKDIGVDGNSVKLKIDPTADVEQHYRDIVLERRRGRRPWLQRPRIVQVYVPPRRRRRRRHHRHH